MDSALPGGADRSSKERLSSTLHLSYIKDFWFTVAEFRCSVSIITYPANTVHWFYCHLCSLLSSCICFPGNQYYGHWCSRAVGQPQPVLPLHSLKPEQHLPQQCGLEAAIAKTLFILAGQCSSVLSSCDSSVVSYSNSYYWAIHWYFEYVC